MAHARDLGHLTQAHVGAECHHARQDFAGVRRMLDAAIEHMFEIVQKIRLRIHKMQQVGNADTRKLAVKRPVAGLRGRWVDQ